LAPSHEKERQRDKCRRIDRRDERGGIFYFDNEAEFAILAIVQSR
jgi:hypothetical protein